MAIREYQTLCPAGHRGYVRLETAEPVALARCPDCGEAAECFLLPEVARRVG